MCTSVHRCKVCVIPIGMSLINGSVTVYVCVRRDLMCVCVYVLCECAAWSSGSVY